MEVLNQNQMYQADQMTIETLGIPGVDFRLENAGQSNCIGDYQGLGD